MAASCRRPSIVVEAGSDGSDRRSIKVRRKEAGKEEEDKEGGPAFAADSSRRREWPQKQTYLYSLCFFLSVAFGPVQPPSLSLHGYMQATPRFLRY